MPLDGYSYLVAHGWSGKGSGLRQGAIARPLAVPQKRTLSGLGKDRDEAFPFWDHLYTVAAKTIQVKLCKDEDSGSETGSSSTPASVGLARTRTGILSNKRPTPSIPASRSGSTTPSLQPVASSSTNTNDPRLNLISAAKREAAKRGLYSRFFRGPVLSSDEGPTASNATPATAVVSNGIVPDTASRDESNSVHKRSEREHGKKEKKSMKDKEEKSKRKRKWRKDTDRDDSDKSDEVGQSDRKRKWEDIAQNDDVGDIEAEVMQKNGKLDVLRNDLVSTGSNGIYTTKQNKENKKRATERKDTVVAGAEATEERKQRRKEGKSATREKSEK